MEAPAGETAGAASAGSASVGDDISELKRYIVDMMHSEMEMVESIRQSEDNMAIMNTRIERLKVSITVEQDRYNTLASVLSGDKQDLKLVEEKQIVAAARHRQYLDEAAEREKVVDRLRNDYQVTRAALLSLRRSLAQMSRLVEALNANEVETNEEMHQVRAQLQTMVITDERAAEIQKLRAKRRYVLEYSSQVEQEVEEVRQTRAQVESELDEHKSEAEAIRQFLQHEELKVESVQARIREETTQVVQETKLLEDKLEVKRKKFRTKTRAEIGSLRKRVQFLSSEMEKETMMNEDIASFLRDRWTERQAADLRLQDQVDRIDSVQGSIASLSRKIDNFDRDGDTLNTSALQEDVDCRRKDLAAVLAVLKKKQEMLQLLKDDRRKLESSMEAIESEREAVGCAIAEADPSIANDRIRDAEAEKNEILESISSVSERNEQLQSECKKLRAANLAVSKEITKLTHGFKAISGAVQKKSAELQEHRDLAGFLNSGIQHGQRLHLELKEFRSKLAQQQDIARRELQEQEQTLQQQYAEREASFQAELDAWDSKIAELRQRQFMAH